jgi:hypothetical protein
MDKELVQKWIDALRSGQYRQAKSKLHIGDRHCCLGVATELIHGQDCWEDSNSTDIYGNIVYKYTVGSTTCEELLDVMDAELVGLSIMQGDLTQEYLSDMNDYGDSFEEIADFLERHLLNDETSYGDDNNG